jgi:hypothetical protein
MLIDQQQTEMAALIQISEPHIFRWAGLDCITAGLFQPRRATNGGSNIDIEPSRRGCIVIPYATP